MTPDPVRESAAQVIGGALCTEQGHAAPDGEECCRICDCDAAVALDALSAAGYRLAGPGEVVVRPERMREIAEALAGVAKAALTVKPTLSKPYPEAPEATPWRQFMEQPARVAYNLACELRRDIRQARATSPAEPTEASDG